MTILTQPQTTVYEGLAAERRLLELGLSRVGLEEVVRRGESARAEATAHDPVNAAGWDAYRYRVRGAAGRVRVGGNRWLGAEDPRGLGAAVEVRRESGGGHPKRK